MVSQQQAMDLIKHLQDQASLERIKVSEASQQ